MAATAISLQQVQELRLRQQALIHSQLTTPAAVVAWLAAVQSQDYLGAKWTLGIRMQPAADDAIEQAFNAGAILRTHMMRPTWHFVAPEDIRWIEELTASRVKSVNAYMVRRLKLDDSALLARCNEILARALQGGRFLTRLELGEALAQAGVAAQGQRLGYIVHQAELEGLVCSGPRRGKQFTYALVEERAPGARVLARDEALAELTLRYYTSHGPATARDLAWWSGLALADVKQGIATAGAQLTSLEAAGQEYWSPPELALASQPPGQAFFLPTYDEYVIGYSSFGGSRLGGQDITDEQGRFDSVLFIDTRAAGSWRRTLKKELVEIELILFSALSDKEIELVQAAAQRYSDYLGLPHKLIIGMQ